MDNTTKRWSKPFSWAQPVKDLLGVRAMYSWENLADALGDLEEFAEDMEGSAQYLQQSDFSPQVIHQALEKFIEPPADYFGTGWNSVQDYDDIFRTLSKLTWAGYDVREQWKTFRSAMSKIWKALPDFYKAERLAAESRDPRIRGIPSSELLDLYRKTELPPNYDPDKPFPQYAIPTDIDDNVKKDE